MTISDLLNTVEIRDGGETLEIYPPNMDKKTFKIVAWNQFTHGNAVELAFDAEKADALIDALVIRRRVISEGMNEGVSEWHVQLQRAIELVLKAASIPYVPDSREVVVICGSARQAFDWQQGYASHLK